MIRGSEVQLGSGGLSHRLLLSFFMWWHNRSPGLCKMKICLEKLTSPSCRSYMNLLDVKPWVHWTACHEENSQTTSLPKPYFWYTIFFFLLSICCCQCLAIVFSKGWCWMVFGSQGKLYLLVFLAVPLWLSSWNSVSLENKNYTHRSCEDWFKNVSCIYSTTTWVVLKCPLMGGYGNGFGQFQWY